eukprot:4772851-Prymnesium_polylepis.1
MVPFTAARGWGARLQRRVDDSRRDQAPHGEAVPGGGALYRGDEGCSLGRMLQWLRVLQMWNATAAAATAVSDSTSVAAAAAAAVANGLATSGHP